MATGRPGGAPHLFTAMRLGRILLMLGAILLAGVAPSLADVTLEEPEVFPRCRQAPTNADVDGTARTIFVFTVTVTVPQREMIDLNGWGVADYVNGTYVTMNGWPMQMTHRADARGSGDYRVSIPGYYFRGGAGVGGGDNDGLPPVGWQAAITFYARSRSTDPASTTPPAEVRIGGPGLRVTGRGREVLVPVDQYGNSDQFKSPKKAGGVTISPSDPANPGDGSASATYTFRVKYIDPEGLPPRPWISYSSLKPYRANSGFDDLGPGISDTITGVETDQFNVPRRLDDPWRFVTQTDPTLPTGVTPPPYRSGVYVVFDDNGDGNVLLAPGQSPDTISWWQNTGDPAALSQAKDAPRFMVIDTDLQPQFLTRNPTAADWKTGVIFKYTCQATDHSVAVGIPRFFEFGSAVLQFALSPFDQAPGMKYLNAGRTGGQTVFDPRTRSFVSLPAGLRRYSFFTSNDCQYSSIPLYSSRYGNWYMGWGYHENLYAGGTVYDTCRRWFQQPNLNLPKTDPQSPPESVFWPPFEIRVDPQITVEQAQLKGDTPLMLIGLPTPVHGFRTTDGVTSEIRLFSDNLDRATPTRFRSTDDLQWRYYYTQSQGLPPSIAELHLQKQDDSGSFVRVAQSPFPTITLHRGVEGRDPLYATLPDATHASPFYAQYATTFPSATTPRLLPGTYRYYFRASDGRRAVEWPGDSAGGTGVTTQAQVSHVSNTVRINWPPALQGGGATAALDATTGAVNWTFQVSYSDADGDAPSQPYLVFPGDPGANDDLKLVMQQDPTTTDFMRGVTYRLQTSTDPTVGAFRNRREFYFAFTDNWKTAANPESGEEVILKDAASAADPDNPPNFFLNSAPFLISAKVVKEGTAVNNGALGDNYVFSVVYGDNERDRPYEDPVTNVPQVRLLIDGAETPFRLTTQDPAPNYAEGVVYSVTINGRQIGPGRHSFCVKVQDHHLDESRRLDATSATVVGPLIDAPVLSQAMVTGTPGIGGTPMTGYPRTDFIYRVRYTHQGAKPPTAIRVHILNPSVGGTPPTELRVVELGQDPLPAGSTDRIETTGLLYSNDPGRDNTTRQVADPTKLVETVRLAATGTYSYYFEASDGDSITSYPRQTAPAETPLVGPVVAGPVLVPQAVSPLRGVNELPFTFRVLCSHPAGVRSDVTLRLIDPAGEVLNDLGGAMDAENYAPESVASPGIVYTKTVTLPADKTGNYRYSFSATDGATTVETTMADGPTVLSVADPDPSGWEVVSTPGQPGNVTYRINYKQSQNLQPVINVVVGGVPHVMAQDNVADRDYTDGATFAAILPRPTGDGPFTYHFTISMAGTELTYYYPTKLLHRAEDPAVTYVVPTDPANLVPATGPNVAPVLTAYDAKGALVADATVEPVTVTPTSGNTGTLFTFQVNCRDLDAVKSDPGQPMDVHYPHVYVVVGNQKIEMTQVSGDINSAEGAKFTKAVKLPVGTLVHSFVADDNFGDPTRLLKDSSKSLAFSGPTVLEQTLLNLTASPTEVLLDGATPVTVRGALDPVIPSAEVVISYTSPGRESPAEETLYAGADGRFSTTWTPTATGVWTVSARLADNAGAGVGGGSEATTVNVTAKQITLQAGLHLIGLPVVPDGGDLSTVFRPSGWQWARYNGSSYDGPRMGSGAATPLPKPGEGMWLFTTTATTASSAGVAVLPNAPKSTAIKPGWNQVANPFLLPISWSAVSFQEAGGATTTLTQAAQGSYAERKIFDHGWLFDPVTRGYVLLHASVPGARREVAPWQGLWIKANSNGSLIFPSPLGRAAQASAEGERRRGRSSGDEWCIQMGASNGLQSDNFNYAGIAAEGRAAELNGIENPPPCMDGYVDLYFTGDTSGRRLATDFRTPVAGKRVFECVVETDVHDRPVTVRAVNLAELPKDLDVFLEDMDAGGKRVYLRTSGGYSFNPGESGSRRLRLVVQPRTEGALRVTAITMQATRGGRSISYAVSRASMTTVEILAPSGKRLKVLSDRRAVSEGMQSVAWDLTRDDGAKLPNGLYMVQVTAITPEGQTARAVKPIAVVSW